jgi:hypothetical protein
MPPRKTFNLVGRSYIRFEVAFPNLFGLENLGDRLTD